MRPNVVLKDLARRAASLVVLSVLMLVPATAAERSLLNIIGYDQGGTYLAFEEYGQSDGTGGFYDHIYVIDLSKDTWVKGAPFNAEDDTDAGEVPLADIRAKAMKLAAPTLKSLVINTPARILLLNGDGTLADTRTVSWSTPNCCGVDSKEDTKFTLSLTEIPIDKKDSGDCADTVGAPIVGFTLAFTDGTDKETLHSDGAQLPKSRGCPLGYDIYAVIDNFATGESRVAIIASWPFGFEGPDRRFLVVPIDGHR
jgi:predicted secreted protein